jgi:16S rRNA C967 or C1407 C5-methylase (RsmB/RsmF family)
MLLDLLREALGPLRFSPAELQSLADSLVQPAQPAIRIRPTPAVELPFPTRPVPWHPLGRFLPGCVRPGAYVHYGAGMYFIQDASSLLAIAALQAGPAEWICDLCASPGGKATAILDSLESGGWLLANEAIQSRIPLLRYQLAKYGIPRFGLSQRDPDRLSEHNQQVFDAVLVDAPCTGQSLVARGKQSLSAFEKQMIEMNAARQSRILAAAARMVRPGGKLVYSTCTFSYLENEARIEDFLPNHGDWELEAVPGLEPWSSPIQKE